MWTGGIPEGFDLGHLKAFIEFWKPTGRFGTAIDGGAHRGVWSRELAKNFREVIAFEANRETYQHLNEQTKEYENIFPYNMALGRGHDYVGTAYHGSKDNTGACHVEGSGQTLMVALDETSWPVDFLKLDIEGMEIFALQGAQAKIYMYRPAIMVELNGNGNRFYGVKDSDVKDWFSARDYVLALQKNKDYLYVPAEIHNGLGRQSDGN